MNLSSVGWGLSVTGAAGTTGRVAGVGVRRMEGVSGLEGAVGGSGTTERMRMEVRIVSGVAALRGGPDRSTALRGGVSGAGGRGPGRSTEEGER